MKGNKVPIPTDAPTVGTYRHYKGDLYAVVGLRLHSHTDEWMVSYDPLYENPDVDGFTQSVKEWNMEMEWPLGSGTKVPRFVFIDPT